jgi:NADH-quinone oxidoreductase subunit B
VQILYDQMPEPKWVIAMGNCAISGGPFVYEGQYGIVEGVGKLFPVDVYIPGCPPRPEALIEGILKLEEKLTGTRRWPVVTPPGLPGPAAAKAVAKATVQADPARMADAEAGAQTQSPPDAAGGQQA